MVEDDNSLVPGDVMGDKVFLDKPEPIIKPKLKRGLPCPDMVDASPLRNPAPSRGDVVWMKVKGAQGPLWQVTRHFILGGVSTGLTVLMTTKNLTLAGAGFVAGGVAAAVRKGVDDKRRVEGKPDGLTALKNIVTRTRGDDVNPILTMLLGSLDSVMVMLKNTMATSDEADKYIKAVSWNVLYFEDELRAMAAKTETPYDDVFVTELVEAATTIWGDTE